MIYLFGAVLVWTGIKLAFEKEQKVEPEKNIFLKVAKDEIVERTKVLCKNKSDIDFINSFFSQEVKK